MYRYRLLKRIPCSIHRDKLATFQCVCCAKLNVQIEESYHCSTSCFLSEWKNHLARHRSATKSVNINDEQEGGNPRTADYKSSLHESAKRMEEEMQLIKVASSKSYIPKMDDAGSNLRLEYAIVDSTGSLLFPISTIETNPVIIAPTSLSRCMIKCLQNGQHFVPTGHSSNDLTFSVLSYNILADMYALTGCHAYCPAWALVWEYRRKKLLHEIIEYDADIICLQEVLVIISFLFLFF